MAATAARLVDQFIPRVRVRKRALSIFDPAAHTRRRAAEKHCIAA
jgi:hypothetical protein